MKLLELLKIIDEGQRIVICEYTKFNNFLCHSGEAKELIELSDQKLLDLKVISMNLDVEYDGDITVYIDIENKN